MRTVTALYTIYDKIAEEAGPLFHAPNNKVARRNYDAMLSQVSDVSKDDYILYRVGEFDTDKAMIYPTEKPVVVGTAERDYQSDEVENAQ